MGVLNVTPDSFSDGGRFLEVEAAVARGLAMVEQGAEVLDVGGESTRPGAPAVDVAIECARVVPVIAAIRQATDAIISIDTQKSEVAEAALDAGAEVVNDVSACTFDPRMVEVVRRRGAGVVLMHMRGRPETMQRGDLSVDDIVAEVAAYLRARVQALVAAGVPHQAIMVDAGIGFGKTVEQNIDLLSCGHRLTAETGCAVLLGASRKSFIGAVTGRRVGDRLMGTAAACVVGVLGGAHLLRVHDVAEMRDVAAVAGVARMRARGSQ